ncbi:relaxase domain-containing protein [Blastococcus mobilis]|uniref:TrwC relaxase n=1 Tax=Blastococcus mobilis TaxID=1938746 RepID=A0A238Y347_9ACTN|nr:relaxase domain-containing protein [Blastococcus mobilis]SNR64739.1 TrwC relaxase [Blastococcus mobilis]
MKSVSALWALAPREVAEQIEAAHAAAVADTVTSLERHACFTRLGAGGVRQLSLRPCSHWPSGGASWNR